MIVREHSPLSLRTSAKKRSKPGYIQMRAKSFPNQLGQISESAAPAFASTRPHYQGIALADDIIVLDHQGKRIPRPEYASLSIDQLPQFKKG